MRKRIARRFLEEMEMLRITMSESGEGSGAVGIARRCTPQGFYRFFCSFRVEFMRLREQRWPGPRAHNAALRLLKVESGINGLLPPSWVPSIYSVSLLIRLRYALEE